MKKMSLVLGFVFVSLMVFTTSCGSSSSPSDVVKSLSYDMESGSTDKVIAAVYNEGKEISDKDKEKFGALVGMAKEQIEKKGGIKTIEIVEETISEDGTEATVKTKTTYGDDSNDEGTTNLIMVDGNWKIKMK